MDFFARQESARKQTGLFELYFALAILGTVILIYFAIVLILNGWTHNGLWDWRIFCGVLAGTFSIIFGGMIFKIAQLASGGSVVAEMMGGVPLEPDGANGNQRVLLNVIEEMSIASGTPMPRVYILPRENAINAFAAGHSTKDMVICVTKGTVQSLTRDELQGVIGHEYSHILNGDMNLNLRLMGLVYGLFCLVILGRVLLETLNIDRSRKDNPLGYVAIAGGVSLLVVGSIGLFFGKLIKSAVSRQREFLADASSVQFTRNPLGLATALKKVGGKSSQLLSPNAEEASHLFFANGLKESFLNLFSTHPPLAERIRALDPSWDGKYIVVDPDLYLNGGTAETGLKNPPPPLNSLPNLRSTIGQPGQMTAMTAAVLMQHEQPNARHLEYAAGWRNQLSPELDSAAREPMTAVALIYALLLSPNDALREQQLDQLTALTETGMRAETEKLFVTVSTLESRARLPLATLALTPLRALSPTQFQTFHTALDYLIASNPSFDLFAYSLQKMVMRRLEPSFVPPKRLVIQYYVLKPLVPDCAILLSALAYSGQDDPAKIEFAFSQGAAKLNLTALPLLPATQCGIPQLDLALEHLNLAVPQIKKLLLSAGAETIAADGVIAEKEAELFRAIADALDCPIPPFIDL